MTRGTDKSSNEEFMQKMMKIGATIREMPGKSPDINLPHLEWPTGEIRGSATNDERLVLETLKGITDGFFLKQVIVTPTNKDGNVLDYY